MKLSSLLKERYDPIYDTPSDPRELIADFYALTYMYFDWTNNITWNEKGIWDAPLKEEFRKALTYAYNLIVHKTKKIFLRNLWSVIIKELNDINKAVFPLKEPLAQKTLKKLKDKKITLDDALIAFRDLKWVAQYGGEPWVNIVLATKNLVKAESDREIISAIDHTIDLQHNTGTVFNKLKGYSEGRIKKLLDAKAREHPLTYGTKYCSTDVKDMLKYFFRNLEKQEIKEKSFKIWSAFYQSDDVLNNSIDINKTVESLMKAFLEYHSDKDIKPNILFYVVDEEEYIPIYIGKEKIEVHDDYGYGKEASLFIKNLLDEFQKILGKKKIIKQKNQSQRDFLIQKSYE